MVVIAQNLVEYGLLASLTTWAAVGGAAVLVLVLWSRRSSRS